jgi:MoaA/NifB/PqqE/SkfB family radical SAM enzyme
VSDLATVPGWLRVKRRALDAAHPLAAHCELTYRCNWRCVFCYNPRHHDRRNLSTAEWVGVVDELQALGVLMVTLTGGEPLAHPGFLEIAAAVRERNLAFRVLTNGALVTDALAAALADLQPLGAELSLHGARAETHDRATALPGSFEAMKLGLDRLRERGVPVLVKTPLTSINESELEDIVALAEGWDVPHQLDANITPRDDGDPAPLAFRASREGVETLYRLVAEKGDLPDTTREAGGLNCGLGRITMAVDPEGDVFPCFQWRQSAMGNVRDTRLRDLWKTSTLRAEAAQVAVDANETLSRRSDALSRFPFCPALAAQRTGDPLQVDEDHEAEASIVHRLRTRQ